MATGSVESDLVDPLEDLDLLSLFPRTIRVSSSNGQVLPNSKDLGSMDRFMNSLVPDISPEKLRAEAQRTLDGGETLKSSIANFAQTVGIGDVIPTKGKGKGKGKNEERRPGLGLARKRPRFSLRPNASQPSVDLEPTLNIDQLEDPEAFFDAYEKLENAKKEIQKQMGGVVENLMQYKPLTNARPRRPGILGRTYNYKHRRSENEDMPMSTQESVEQDAPGSPENNSQKEITDIDPNLDLHEVELPGSLEKEQNENNHLLDEFLSRDTEDLDGDGILNLLQERLNIKPLNLDKLTMLEHDTEAFEFTTSQKAPKNSLLLDSLLKNVGGEQYTEYEQVMQNSISPMASPSSSGSPVASLSLLKKRILQSNPLRDTYVPLNVNLSLDASDIQPKQKPHNQVDELKDSSMSSESKSRGEAELGEPETLDMDSQKLTESSDSLPNQFDSESGGRRIAHADGNINVESDYHVEEAIIVVNFKSSKQDRSAQESTCSQIASADSRPDVEQNSNIEEATVVEDLNCEQSNLHGLGDDGLVSTSRSEQPDKHHEFQRHQPKRQKRQREAGENHLRKVHPMRKSIAERGTYFEAGVRRSKRVRLRPLEFWKGEKPLYERVDGSLKLTAFTCDEGDGVLKVKPINLL